MKYGKQGENESIEDLSKKIENYKICEKSNVAFTLERMIQISVNVLECCT